MHRRTIITGLGATLALPVSLLASLPVETAEPPLATVTDLLKAFVSQSPVNYIPDCC
jgi:hypothetical protein